MTHWSLVKIKTQNKNKTLLKLNNLSIDVKNIKYENKYLILEMPNEDIKKAQKYLISEKITKLDDIGFIKIKENLKHNLLFIVSLIFGIIVFLILTNIIVKVNIIHSSTEIRELLRDALKEEGVKPLTLKKNYQEYEDIILKIKNKYKDKIEWLEIEARGMVINVRVEERINTTENKEYGTCHIVAFKSGTIKNILALKGVAEVKINDYVKKGDILINGMIKLNDEVKSNVCARGVVEAEVWYTINASIPLNYTKKIVTNKSRYNLMIKTENKEYVILKSRIKGTKEIKNIKLFKLFNLTVYIQREYQVKEINEVYSEAEALEALNANIHEKLSVMGIQFDKIIAEKYLKKSVFNGKLDIDMFVAVLEQIGVAEYYKVETESGTSDKEHNGNNNTVN